MSVMEQLIDDMGYEKYIETVISLGVTELNMTRFIIMLEDDNGNKMYIDWLEGNSIQIAKKFEEEYMSIFNDEKYNALLMSVCIVNEFIKWLDSVQLN